MLFTAADIFNVDSDALQQLLDEQVVIRATRKGYQIFESIRQMNGVGDEAREELYRLIGEIFVGIFGSPHTTLQWPEENLDLVQALDRVHKHKPKLAKMLWQISREATVSIGDIDALLDSIEIAVFQHGTKSTLDQAAPILMAMFGISALPGE